MIDLRFHEEFLDGIKKNFPNININKALELLPHFDIIHIPKKQHIIKAGTYYGKIVIVISGLFRAYYYSEIEEHTFWFREEHTIFAAHRCILQNKPSSISYQAIEDSIVAVIDYFQLKEIAENDTEVAKSIIAALESLLLELIDRVEEFVTYLPEDRYKVFIEKHSNIITRLPQNQLASYLGITPVSFSRMKNRMMHR